MSETLSQRAYQLVQSVQQEPLLYTTGTRTSVELLIARTRVLEQAVSELALAVQKLEQHTVSFERN